MSDHHLPRPWVTGRKMRRQARRAEHSGLRWWLRYRVALHRGAEVARHIEAARERRARLRYEAWTDPTLVTVLSRPRP